MTAYKGPTSWSIVWLASHAQSLLPLPISSSIKDTLSIEPSTSSSQGEESYILIKDLSNILKDSKKKCRIIKKHIPLLPLKDHYNLSPIVLVKSMCQTKKSRPSFPNTKTTKIRLSTLPGKTLNNTANSKSKIAAQLKPPYPLNRVVSEGKESSLWTLTDMSSMSLKMNCMRAGMI